MNSMFLTALLTYTCLACLVSGLAPADLSKRIYGGYALPEFQAPFEVSVATIKGKEVSACGGTLISSSHVVTAAHCLVPYKASYPVKVGYNSQNKSEQTVVQATKVTIHPKYLANSEDGRYDIAILEIPRVTFNKQTQRIPIYSSKINIGQELLAVGWGKTENTSTHRDALRATAIIIGDYKTCRQFKSNFQANNDPRVCALGKLTPGDGICMGDSGSSVSLENNGQQYYVGIGSRMNFLNGAGCGDKDSASFFVHVWYFLDYIVQNTGLSREYLLGQDSESTSPSAPAYTALPTTTSKPTTSACTTPSPTVSGMDMVTVTITEYLIRTAWP
ncbi:hypothetical protein IWW49_001803 [Coemansia sp. RSA 1797]|nr:hypothetical protein IWW49_001803 [Coemansia sp. RSA 1797]